jgi:NAD(P)-dependent dehydrogenase (short-subunit alcohol dehydrogenase family)
MTDTKTKTWLITGASKGFGREWADAALDRGDRVAATVRCPETLTIPRLGSHSPQGDLSAAGVRQSSF